MHERAYILYSAENVPGVCFIFFVRKKIPPGPGPFASMLMEYSMRLFEGRDGTVERRAPAPWPFSFAGFVWKQ